MYPNFQGNEAIILEGPTHVSNEKALVVQGI